MLAVLIQSNELQQVIFIIINQILFSTEGFLCYGSCFINQNIYFVHIF
jgi:hypothetical protein